jgi:hypothetical protein
MHCFQLFGCEKKYFSPLFFLYLNQIRIVEKHFTALLFFHATEVFYAQYFGKISIGLSCCFNDINTLDRQKEGEGEGV